MIDVTVIIVAALGAIPATVAAYAALENNRVIKHVRTEATAGRDVAYQVGEDNRIATAQVHEEVKTGNGLTNGQIADALYTHQIEQTKNEDRTAGEDVHMDSMAENQAPDALKRSKDSG